MAHTDVSTYASLCGLISRCLRENEHSRCPGSEADSHEDHLL